MFETRTRLFFFACLEDAAGAALKSVGGGGKYDLKGQGGKKMKIYENNLFKFCLFLHPCK